MNDSDSGEDDTTRYFVNEKPPSFGRATHQRSQISCLVLGLAVEWAGRGGAAGGGEGGTTALLGLPGEAVGSAARPPRSWASFFPQATFQHEPDF